ncbi:MAG: DNA-processing protein DprA [Devosiaceae bacterium]|nr:DNA-processing protein DprA [Devosiaceae bacterium]
MYGSTPTSPPMNKSQLISWLRLIRSSNVGPTTFRQLINRFGSANAALEILPELTLRGGAKSAPKICSIEQAENEIEQLDSIGARLVSISDADYPFLLKHIHSPPPLLAIAGQLPRNDNKSLAIIGARNASASGRKLAQTIAEDLGEQGYMVISGLARGIDFAAHSGAIKTGTVAVFAGGIDQIYPKENINLAEQILDTGGALVSEMAFGSMPRAKDFPRRNRLVSGMSRGVLVIEAALRSGSLITARYGLEQDREIFAIPGSPMDPRAAGTNRLIRDGAKLVTGASDILEEFELGENSPDLFLSEEGVGDDLLPADLAEISSKIQNEASAGDHQTVLNSLSVTPVAIDDLINATSLSAPIVQTILLELDLAGRIERSSGQLVALI